MPDAPPMCNNRVGDRTIAYSCYLPRDHAGPCAAHEDERSKRVRAAWERAQADLSESQGAPQTFWEMRGEPGGGTAAPGQTRTMEATGDFEVTPDPDFVRGTPLQGGEGWGVGEEGVPPLNPAPNRSNVPRLASVQMVENIVCPTCDSIDIDPLLYTGEEPGGGGTVSFRRCMTCGGFFSPPVVIEVVSADPVELLRQIRDDMADSSLAVDHYVRRLDEVLRVL